MINSGFISGRKRFPCMIRSGGMRKPSEGHDLPGVCRLRTFAVVFSVFFGLLSLANADSGQGTDDALNIPGPGYTQIVSLIDGSTIIGRIVSVGDMDIVFETAMGRMIIPREKISEVQTVPDSSFKRGKYWFPNPNQTRLYLAPTARMLRKGEGYFTDIYLLFPGVAVGLTDNITIGGGISLIPGVDMDEQVLYFTPKLGVSATKTFAVSATALIVRVPNDDDPVLAGVLFGTGTIGTADNSLTFGLGYGFADGELADKPAVLLGGELRAARRLALVTENWIFPGVDDALVSYGLRFFGESIAVDLALFNVTGEDAIMPGLPFVGFVYNF